jgi:hypothetical protein
MGKFRLLIILFQSFLSSFIYAQVPQKMSYQAVIRNNSNVLVVNSPVGMQISILQTSVSGTVVYSETHAVVTNANGLVSLEIGNGTPVLGSFSAINWANGPYFVKTETDPLGGTNYTITGTSQLLSVPYAQLAENVVNPKYSVSVTDDSATSLAQTIRNTYINDPDISLVVPETGRYLLVFSGNAFNNNSYLNSVADFDFGCLVRVYNNTTGIPLFEVSATERYLDYMDPTNTMFRYLTLRPSKSVFVDLIQGNVLRLQYNQRSNGTPSATWTMGSGSISILKIGN